MNAYRQFTNQQAFQMINKSIHLPIASLGIGVGEELAPLPHIVEYPNPIKQGMLPDLNTASYENASIDGYAEPIDQSLFPMTLYYGNSIEGV